MSIHKQTLVLYVLGALLLLSSLSTSVLSYLNGSCQRSLAEYTFEEDDYPAYYPIALPMVSLTPENTVHYQIYSSDGADEWASVFPEGGGFLSLGPKRRPFGIALFHQMHCLIKIREAMNTHQHSDHTDHCFNYLRQSILCEANPSIEPSAGGRNVDSGVPRICKDWSMVYDIAAQNYHSIIRNSTA